MDETLFDLEDYYYYNNNCYDYEHFSDSGYPFQDEFAEDPDIIYYDEYEPF